jgi:hypothetical protein
MQKFHADLANKLMSLVGESNTLKLKKWKTATIYLIINLRNNVLQRTLFLIGFKRIVFTKYAILNIESELPALVLHGFYGITLIGKKRYVSSKILINNYTQHPRYLEIIGLSQLNNGYIPISIFESIFLKFDGYQIKPIKGRMKLVESQTHHHKILIVGNPNRKRVMVPYTEGFFHFYVEVIPTILENRNYYCFILQIPEDQFYLHILNFFNLQNFEVPKSDVHKYISTLTIEKKCLYPSKRDLRTLQNFTNKNIDTASRDTNRIYITRRNNKNGRRIRNENSLISLLELNDFIIIDTDEISFTEQVRLMSTACVVVSAHGAALSHLVSVSSKTKVIELNGDIDVRWHFFQISRELGLEYILVLGKTINAYEFCIDVNKVKDALSIFLE